MGVLEVEDVHVLTEVQGDVVLRPRVEECDDWFGCVGRSDGLPFQPSEGREGADSDRRRKGKALRK